MLKVKTITGGLNTDKLDGRNCTVRTAPMTPQNHRVMSIGKETMVPFGNLGSFGVNDLNNTLFENEVHTHLSYDDLRGDATSA